jgi:flagellar motor switch protein FliN/FliY
MALTRDDILRHFGEEVAAAVAALAERKADARPGGEARPGGYRLTLTPVEGGAGRLFVQIDEPGATTLARCASPRADAGPHAVAEALKEIGQQAGALLIARHAVPGAMLAVESIEPAADAPEADGLVLAQVLVQDEADPAQLAVWGDLELAGTPEPEAEAAADADPAPQETAAAATGPSLDVILDMELPLVVRFGRTEMTLKALSSLAPGAVIDLGRSPDDPVEVLVSNKVVARGEVVTVSGNYGVRITDVISPAERVRYMEVAS